MAFKNELMTEEEKKEFLSHGYRIMPRDCIEISCYEYSRWTIDKEKKIFLKRTHKENVMEVGNDKERTIFLFSVNGKVYYVYLLDEHTGPYAFTWHWNKMVDVNGFHVSDEEEQTVKKLIKEALIVFGTDGMPEDCTMLFKPYMNQCKIDFDF